MEATVGSATMVVWVGRSTGGQRGEWREDGAMCPAEEEKMASRCGRMARVQRGSLSHHAQGRKGLVQVREHDRAMKPPINHIRKGGGQKRYRLINKSVGPQAVKKVVVRGPTREEGRGLRRRVLHILGIPFKVT